MGTIPQTLATKLRPSDGWKALSSCLLFPNLLSHHRSQLPDAIPNNILVLSKGGGKTGKEAISVCRYCLDVHVTHGKTEYPGDSLPPHIGHLWNVTPYSTAESMTDGWMAATHRQTPRFHLSVGWVVGVCRGWNVEGLFCVP